MVSLMDLLRELGDRLAKDLDLSLSLVCSAHDLSQSVDLVLDVVTEVRVSEELVACVKSC